MGNRTKTWTTGAVVVLGGLALMAEAAPQGPRSRAGCVRFAASGTERTPLDKTQQAAVVEALQDEWQGEAIYARVLEDHGDIRPFSNVVHAERRHSAFLEDLIESRGLPVPENRWAGSEVPAYVSRQEACVAAVEFEVRNVALYDRLLAAGPLPEDVRLVFEHNRMASLDHHKPAFERCAGRAGAPGRGATASGVGRRGCGHHGCGHHGCGRGGGRGRSGGGGGAIASEPAESGS